MGSHWEGKEGEEAGAATRTKEKEGGEREGREQGVAAREREERE